eukprot:CAMPEP_0117666174 /NCGR_PEP_ID=MMETSP0804-20121206/10227_1 /TAXON_ID=1074897 /ORGANISM="Tetraselmis astigmatica, Strain CCMP880" /LENGTH=369 /DNA_ID=CAMNT_0005473685 /DNA_START=252 /DNA_END=1361 /DNA_ORIENTATION=+
MPCTQAPGSPAAICDGKPPKAVIARRGSRGLSNCEFDGSPLPVDNSQLDLCSIKRLFREQRSNVDHFWEELDYDQVRKFAQACVDCKGVICFTGVGKSGFIAHKVTQTLVSTGTKAVFLSPTDALHGDIGILSESDLLVLMFSQGDDDELMKLVPYAKAKGAKLVSVSTVKDNPLNSYCDLNVELPLKRELCPYNMEPATSTSLQILFGDTVAIALMQARKVSKTEYAMNHPAGRFGKQLMLHVADIMATGSQVPMVNSDDKVVEVLMELSGKAHGCVVVIDSNKSLVGSFTDGDLRRALLAHGENALDLIVSEVMHKNPKTVKASMMAVDAMTFMNSKDRRVSFAPVVDDEGFLVGILTLHMCVAAGL